MNAENFIILMLTHLVSDYFFQPSYWGCTKIKNWKTRLLHSMQYALIFLPILYVLNINFLWLIYLCITHFIIDSYIPVHLWNKHVKNAIKRKQLAENEPPRSVVIGQDQILHLLLLIPIVI